MNRKRSIGSLFWLLIILALPSHLLALEIDQVFLSLTHKRFQESLRPFVHSLPYSPESKKARITRQEILHVFETYAKEATIDRKNYFMSFRKDSAMGGYDRTYVLYFSSEQLPVFVGSEKNSSIHDDYTGIFALCQTKELKWEDCTKSILPDAKILDFVKPNAQLGKPSLTLFSLYYDLPRQGTTITGKIICDEYAFANSSDASWEESQRRLNKEKQKFQRLSFHLKWDKEQRLFSIQP